MAPRPVDKEKKKLKLLESATAVFAEKGYNATTIDAVAERAGVAKGTIYQYFSSKQDLFFGVFDAFVQQYFAAVRERTSAPGTSAESRIRQATQAVFELAIQDQDLLPLTFEFWSASASSEIRERFGEAFKSMYAVLRQIFGELLREGIERGEFRADVDINSLTAVLVGSFDGLFLQAWFDSEMDPVRAGNAFMDVFIQGLQPGVGKEGGPA